jgi:enoyl reductase-like protein
MKVLNDFIEPYVERAILQSQLLVDTEERVGDINFTNALSRFTTDRTVLRDQLVSTLLAGRDTTACTLSWLFYELAYHPDVYKTLRDEVLKTLGRDRKPTYNDLKSMKYMQWCLNEGSHLSWLTKSFVYIPLSPSMSGHH